jgi:5-methylcytosine-specific restriction enzyme A
MSNQNKNQRIPTHKPKSLPARDSRPSAHRRGYTRRWAALSQLILRDRPICERCNRNISTEVHHLDGLGPNGPRGYDMTNLQALCKSCHSQITGSTSR